MDKLFLNLRPMRIIVVYLAVTVCLIMLGLLIFNLEQTQRHTDIPVEYDWLYKDVSEDYGFT